jgi:hypothetical protein
MVHTLIILSHLHKGLDYPINSELRMLVGHGGIRNEFNKKYQHTLNPHNGQPVLAALPHEWVLGKE